MEIDAVPASLRERLGPEATGGLLHLLDIAHGEWRADLIAACTERYERRLAEEIAGVRVQIAQVEASLRTEMAQMGASIRQDIASGRVELLKWCFLFWIGQVVTVGSIVGLMLRLTR